MYRNMFSLLMTGYVVYEEHQDHQLKGYTSAEVSPL